MVAAAIASTARLLSLFLHLYALFNFVAIITFVIESSTLRISEQVVSVSHLFEFYFGLFLIFRAFR